MVHFCEKGNGYLLKERKFIPNIKEYKSLKVSENGRTMNAV
jgi:hypothetical protein